NSAMTIATRILAPVRSDLHQANGRPSGQPSTRTHQPIVRNIYRMKPRRKRLDGCPKDEYSFERPAESGLFRADFQRAAVDRMGIEVPGGIAEPGKHDRQPDEKRDRSEHEQDADGDAPANHHALVRAEGAKRGG